MTRSLPTPFASLARLAADLRSGEMTSIALTQECLDRIAAHDGYYKSFLAIHADEALDAARRADAELRAGHDRGPLHGIPLAVKDLVDMAGKPTTAGSPLLAGNVATHDAAIVRRIAEAGGVIVGKTHLVQFALGAWGTNSHMDTPRNPASACDEHLVAGGSSSGSAVAVSAHLVPWAIGTDTGGSVRVPAAFCGVVGFKPTIDALPRAGVYALSDSLDSLGLLTTSVKDARLCFEVLAGVVSATGRGDGRGRRLGILVGEELQPLLPAVARNFARNLQTLKEAGFHLLPFRFPAPLNEFRAPTNAIMIAEGAWVNDRFLDDPQAPIDPSVRPRLLTARSTTVVQYLQAKSTAARWQEEFTAEMDRLNVSAVVTPVTSMTAPRIEEVDHDVAPVHFTRPVNLMALCGIALPAGVDDEARPIGLQLIGRARGDAQLLEIAGEVATVITSSTTHAKENHRA